MCFRKYNTIKMNTNQGLKKGVLVRQSSQPTTLVAVVTYTPTSASHQGLADPRTWIRHWARSIFSNSNSQNRLIAQRYYNQHSQQLENKSWSPRGKILEPTTEFSECLLFSLRYCCFAYSLGGLQFGESELKCR